MPAGAPAAFVAPPRPRGRAARGERQPGAARGRPRPRLAPRRRRHPRAGEPHRVTHATGRRSAGGDVRPGRDLARIDATVAGRVQGVGFRWFVLDVARRLELRGWVANEADGSVRCVAEGPGEDLEALVVELEPRARRRPRRPGRPALGTCRRRARPLRDPLGSAPRRLIRRARTFGGWLAAGERATLRPCTRTRRSPRSFRASTAASSTRSRRWSGAVAARRRHASAARPSTSTRAPGTRGATGASRRSRPGPSWPPGKRERRSGPPTA